MLEGEQLAAWLSHRAGRLTASRMNDALAVKKNGEPTAERAKLMRELLAERLTGSSVRHFVTDAMQHGLDCEDEAKAAYEAHTGELLGVAGFYDHPRIDNLGASPDSLLSNDGLAEFKCPQPATFVSWVLAGAIPDEHKLQMATQLACSGRGWCEFVAYEPHIRDPERRLFIRRYTPTAHEIAAVEAGAEKFLQELDAMFDAFTQAAA